MPGAANKMTNENEQDHFEKYGFVHLHAVFSDDEAMRIRTHAETIFAAPAGPLDRDHDPVWGGNRCAVFQRFGDLRWILFHPRLVDALKRLIGPETTLLPEASILRDFYSRWHRDTNSPIKDRQYWIASPEMRLIQVAIYLQANGSDGGGLDVVPGSHREVGRLARLAQLVDASRSGGALARTLCGAQYRGLNAMQKATEARHGPTSIPTSPGDVVLFDFGILHRATPRQSQRVDLPVKHGIFFVCAPNRKAADAYLAYLAGGKLPEMITHYPFDDEMRAAGRAAGIELV